MLENEANGDGEEPERDDRARDLGRAIKVRRTVLDWSRRELADRAGLSYSYLAEIENGSKQASSKALYAIAEALAISPSELLRDAETITSESVAAQRLENPHGTVKLSGYRPAGPTEAAGPGPAPRRPRAGARELQRRWFERRQLPSRLAADDEFEARLSEELVELDSLLRDMAPSDRERLLDMARRLAHR